METEQALMFQSFELADEREVIVVRDDLSFIGGTKQRGLNLFVQRHSEKEFIYATSPFGFAQVALAAACKLHRKKATIFVAEPDPHDEGNLSELARSLGAKVTFLSGKLSDAQRAAEEYHRSTSCSSFLFPFGLDCDEFLSCLEEALRAVIPKAHSSPKRIWITAGSGTLSHVLHRIFPQSQLMMVQIGRDFDPPPYQCVFLAPEKFWEPAKILPPFPSAKNYDAKMWQFVLKLANDGDLVWNVAAEPPRRSPQKRVVSFERTGRVFAKKYK